MFKRPIEAGHAGIETVYETPAVAPSFSPQPVSRCERLEPGPIGEVLRMLDHGGMSTTAKSQMTSLGIGTWQNMSQAVETKRSVRCTDQGRRGAAQ